MSNSTTISLSKEIIEFYLKQGIIKRSGHRLLIHENPHLESEEVQVWSLDKEVYNV